MMSTAVYSPARTAMVRAGRDGAAFVAQKVERERDAREAMEEAATTDHAETIRLAGEALAFASAELDRALLDLCDTMRDAAAMANVARVSA